MKVSLSLCSITARGGGSSPLANSVGAAALTEADTSRGGGFWFDSKGCPWDSWPSGRLESQDCVAITSSSVPSSWPAARRTSCANRPRRFLVGVCRVSEAFTAVFVWGGNESTVEG